jgi:hypothetical protein
MRRTLGLEPVLVGARLLAPRLVAVAVTAIRKRSFRHSPSIAADVRPADSTPRHAVEASD